MLLPLCCYFSNFCKIFGYNEWFGWPRQPAFALIAKFFLSLLISAFEFAPRLPAPHTRMALQSYLARPLLLSLFPQMSLTNSPARLSPSLTGPTFPSE